MLSPLSIKLILLGIAAAIIVTFTIRYEEGRVAVEQNKELKADITAGNEGNAESAALGKSLNEKEAQYVQDTREQDKVVPVTGPTFDAASVQRIKARISAGKAARQRNASVR